jgi:serine/threonine protein kinase
MQTACGLCNMKLSSSSADGGGGGGGLRAQVTTFHDKANLYMLISLCQGGDLLAAQESWKNARMDESCVQFYLGCIVLALEYMHSLNIAYRDMKQENMMIDAQGYLKMVDYGLSKVVSDGIKAFTVCGTAQFIAPEVITCKGHGKEVDMWSLGVLAFELLVGESPFVDDSDMEPEEIFKSIVRGRYKIPSFVSANAADLIMNLLRREPNARLGCARARALDALALSS